MKSLSGDKILRFLIYAYIVIVMVSESTGSFGVKLIRVFLAGAFVLYLMTNKNKYYKPSFYIAWSLIFLAYNAFMSQYALNPEYAKDYTMTLMYVIITNLMIEYYMSEDNITEGIMRAIIIGAIAQGTYVFMTNGFLVFMNSRGTSNVNANSIGLNNAIALVFSVYLIGKTHKRIYKMEAIIVLVYMILSASRKVFIIAGVPLVIYYLLNSKNFVVTIRNIFFILIAVILVYVAVMRIPLLYDLVGVRLETMVSGFQGGETDGSTETRMNLIEYGMEWYKKKPWFGYGLSNFMELMHRYKPGQISYYAHNNYVELLVDCGIVGFAIYYIFYAITIIKGLKCIKNRNAISVMMLGLFVGLAVAEYGVVSYYLPIYQLVLFLCYRTFAHDKKIA